MNRRTFIVVTSLAATVAVAGCSGGDGGTDTSSPEAVVESFYDLDAEAAQELFHSESPQSSEESGGSTDTSTDNADATVVSEDLNESELEAEFPDQFGSSDGSSAVSDEVKVTIAEENAVVEVSYDFSSENLDGTQELTATWLTATEDGEWQLVVADTE